MTVTSPVIESKVTPDSGRVRSARVALLSLAIAIPNVLALPGGVLWPEPAKGDWYSYGDIAPIRDRWWGLLTFLAVGVVVATIAQAIAVLRLAPRRGAGWTTTGAVMMWLGAGLQAVGVGGWAATYFFLTDSSLDASVATSLIKDIASDPHMFAIAMPGAVLVALGTVCQAVGLLRSRTIPKWVPILTLAIVGTFFVENAGWIGVVIELPIAASSVAIAWYVWARRA